MKNIFVKRILITLRDKQTLFWTWIFPIILATLFTVAIPDAGNTSVLSPISVGVVKDAAYKEEQTLDTVLRTLSDEGNDDRVFILKYFDSFELAEDSLKNNKVDAIISVDVNPALTVKNNGINQTVVKNFLDSYIQNKNIIIKAVQTNPLDIIKIQGIMNSGNAINEIKVSKNNVGLKANYFFALLGMVCMYGGFQGLITITCFQANLSPLGARTAISPTKKAKMILTDLAAGYLCHLAFVLFVLAFMVFVLKVDFGNQIGFVIINCALGSLVGVTMGSMVSATSKLKESIKVAIIITISLSLSFLSGLMVGGVNYIVAEKLPVLSYINPVARITDAFYALNVYDNYEKYTLNILILLAFSVVFAIVTSIMVRRQQYESI